VVELVRIFSGAHGLGVDLHHQGDEVDRPVEQAPGFLAQRFDRHVGRLELGRREVFWSGQGRGRVGQEALEQPQEA